MTSNISGSDQRKVQELVDDIGVAVALLKRAGAFDTAHNVLVECLESIPAHTSLRANTQDAVAACMAGHGAYFQGLPHSDCLKQRHHQRKEWAKGWINAAQATAGRAHDLNKIIDGHKTYQARCQAAEILLNNYLKAHPKLGNQNKTHIRETALTMGNLADLLDKLGQPDHSNEDPETHQFTKEGQASAQA